MAATRTPGITLDARGDLILDKEYRGIGLFRRLGRISLQGAESILQSEMARLAAELDLRMHARPLFRHCAARYLAESKQKRTVDTIAWHVRLLLAHFGDFHSERIHDGSLQPFIELRQSEGVGATTINRSLEVMRTILNRAARAYRDDDGRPWLERVPPQISMLPESPRPPCPITWRNCAATRPRTRPPRRFARRNGYVLRRGVVYIPSGPKSRAAHGLGWRPP